MFKKRGTYATEINKHLDQPATKYNNGVAMHDRACYSISNTLELNMLTTTLNEVLKHGPCSQHSDRGGWGLLLKNLNKNVADDAPLTIMQILESNGIKDAIWSLRCFKYKEYCLFLADVAESVLHIYEENNSNKSPRLAIEGIRAHHAGKLDIKELLKLADAAAAAAAADAAAAAYAATAADAATAAATAAAAAYAAAAAAYAAAAAAAARQNKWEEIKQLFIKHFGA